MKTKIRFDILVSGVVISWLLGFIALLFRLPSGQSNNKAMWGYLIAGIAVWLYKMRLDKLQDVPKLERGIQVLIVVNLGIFWFAFCGYFLAMDSAKGDDLTYFFIGLGLPSLISFLWHSIYLKYYGN